MKKFLLFLFSLITITCYSQPGDSTKIHSLIHTDPLQGYDSTLVASTFDSLQSMKSIDFNMRGILEMQNEQRERQKKAAILRIGIGIALLVVLVIGLRRKRVKKDQ